MTADIAVDGGQSGLRIGLVEDGRVRLLDEADGFTYRPGADPIADDAATVVAAVRAVGIEVGRVGLGLTNAPPATADRGRLARAIRVGLGARSAVLAADFVTAHLGALAGADGVVLTAGTGAVCLGVAGGTTVRSDGLGYLLGDDGSGFAVGRAGLRSALRAGEGRGPHTQLEPAMRRRFADVPDFPHGLYRSPRAVERIASFSREVAAAADTGDAVALAIWSAAVDDLVDAVVSVVARCPELAAASVVPVSYAGGLFAVTDHVLRPFTDRLVAALPSARLRPPAGTGLDGAAGLLTERAAGYGDLVTVAGERP
jgi:glucosamine kinase